MQLRILVVSQYFWPENFRINDLVEEWLLRGHSVTVLTGIPNYPIGKVFDDYRNWPGAFTDFKGARVVRVPMLSRGTSGLRLILNYLTFALGGLFCGPWLLRGKPADVIFVFQPSPVTVGLPAVLLGKIKNAPVVLWVLDLWPDSLAGIGAVRSKLVLGWIGHLVRFIYNRCALVLGQSRAFLDKIALHCDAKSKVRYFPSWAEEVFENRSIRPAPEVPQRSDKFNVVFTGNVGEAQDMKAVLDAVERLKDNASIRWIIVGDGRKFKWLQAEVSRLGLCERVVMPGRFPVERMPSFYAHADALLVSLKSDPVYSLTIPGKVQSYLMAGIPLLGMLDGEGASVILDAKAGLICKAGDGAGLARSVMVLYAMSPTERSELGLNGRKYALREFGRDQLMDRMESILTDAVSARNSKA